MASISDLAQLVMGNITTAIEVAGVLQLEARQKYAAAKGMLADLPKYRGLTLGSAAKAWSAVLFVDMRGSTERAKYHGARNTYITMHAFLPAMAYLVNDFNGYVVGFRGDGLFAAFGIAQGGGNVVPLDKGRTVASATACGQTMLEAVSKVINPALETFDIPAGVRIGVGVDVGEIVITRIGLNDSFEITAYGDAVNSASKLSSVSDGEVRISTEADRLFPVASGGGPGTVSLEAANVLPAGPHYRVQFRSPTLPGPGWKEWSALFSRSGGL